MLERCPGCRFRLAGDAACPRCGCDLALVRRCEQQAGLHLRRAVQAWAQGDRAQVQASARAALALDPSPLARTLLG